MESAVSTASSEGQKSTKFSRYRSVRKSARHSPPAPYPGPVEAQSSVQQSSSFSLKRMPSRYRTRPEPSPSLDITPPVPALPITHSNTVPDALQRVRPTRYRSPQADPVLHTGLNIKRTTTDPSEGVATTEQPAHSSPTTSPVTEPTQSSRMSPPKRYERERNVLTHPKSTAENREEARMILEGKYDQREKLKHPQAVVDVKLPSGSGIKKSADEVEYAGKKQTRLNDHQGQSPALSSSRQQFQMVDAPNLKRKIFQSSNRTKLSTNVVPSHPVQSPHNADKSKISAVRDMLSAQQTTAITKVTQEMENFDAPVSAVNSGGRRVTICCNNSRITLPVNPSTTARDVINSTSICMSENIDPRTAVLVEAFSEGGLERYLRNYERVREVMNSWENDTSNHLLIMNSTQSLPTTLDQKAVPKEQPTGTCLQLYVSSRARKWDKRWLHLQQNGQITVSKDQNGSDGTNICHLSDFDVYMPTKSEIKKLKPPKKFCLTIKSQQKAAMFLDGVNYVHHFCCNDSKMFEQWRNTVQVWRSWYLINVLGEGTTRTKPETTNELNSKHHMSRQSADVVPYQLGSFTPLLDLAGMRVGNEGSKHQPSDSGSHSSLERAHKPLLDFSETRGDLSRRASVRRSVISNDANTPSYPDEDTSAGFTGSGLLARSASRRSQGGRASGRGLPGVKGKPLLDLAAVSEFTDGSLLHNIEVNTASPVVRIDRIKRIDADVRVGEGL